MLRINVGCGQTPTQGWRNFDNSLSLRLARYPTLVALLRRVRFIDDGQYGFIKFAQSNSIEYGDAVTGLPILAGSVDVLYTSHMLEHLDRSGADAFLAEAWRLLRPGGRLRIAVPDLKKMLSRYADTDDADKFLESTHLCVPHPRTIVQRLRILFTGTRHHQWLYDGVSLCRLLRRHGFVDAKVVPAGETTIPEPSPLNLFERDDESVYVEASNPAR